MLDDRLRACMLREPLLSQSEEDRAHWPWLSELQGDRSDKKSANKFILGAVIDFQIDADQAWENARRLSEIEFGDPDDLWDTIHAVSESDWESRFKLYRLHRFQWAHMRVWRIGREIVRRYGGDARRIWEHQTAAKVLKRLIGMRVGDQISRMIVGALNDTGQIEELGDLKADLHVRRVLGRLFTGNKVSVQEAHRLARLVARGPTWPLDAELFRLGKGICGAEPECKRCYLKLSCSRGSGS